MEAVAAAFGAAPLRVTRPVGDPIPVGQPITWTAEGGGDGQNWYRFAWRGSASEPYRVIRDYGPGDTVVWAADHEGSYELDVSARDQLSGEVIETSVPFQVVSRVHPGGPPVLSETTHPLTFLYSAPPCPVGSRMRVQMTSPEGRRINTPYQDCTGDVSMNFYLSGMRSGSLYLVNHAIDDGSKIISGPELDLSIPEATVALPGYTVRQAHTGPAPDGVLLHSPLFQSPVATDLDGNVIWYYPGILSFLTRPAADGSFWGIVQDYGADPSGQILREIDLAGLTIRETNAARINEQLAAMGKNSVGSFHHDARSMPDGSVLALASTERILTDVQGAGPVDVLGDMILVLDRNLQVTWAWDAFDFLDASKPAILGETCGPNQGGCPPIYLDTHANDWLHGNSVQFLRDGSILYSARHLDWVIKIDYGNGSGSGQVLWRLGRGGDFQLVANDPDPWFSHQHDPEFQTLDDTTLALFDNGNFRGATDPTIHSRGQSWRIDEQNRTATLLLNADMGTYSIALGSAHVLPDGNYHFNVGLVPTGGAWSIEVDSGGNTVYSIESSVPDYRSFRMPNLYQP